MKKVLLTGGSGFIGQNIREYFKNSTKYEITAPNSQELNCIDEICVKQYLKKKKFDIILNFAVYGDGIDKKKDGSKILEYNLRMFYNFANHSDLYGRMFYSGSGAEFDKRKPICSVHEEDVGQSIPIDQYGLMKYIVGRYIENSNNIYNLRLFGLFGKYEYWPIKFISNICCKSLVGLPMSIRQNLYFDYLWIDDFLKILEKIIEKENLKHHTYNVVSGQRVDLISLCHAVNECAEEKSRVIICKEGKGNEYTASNDRLVAEFPDIKFTSIYDSIEKLYMWYKAHISEIEMIKLLY